MPATSPTRRQRVREATTEEILAVATDLVAHEGAAGLSLRGVARTMEIAPSALYRYFPSREALLTALIVAAYDSLGEAVEEGVAAAGEDCAVAILNGVHAFRTWAVSHPHEFGLLYGTPVPGYVAPEDTSAPAMRTPTALLGVLRRALDEGLVVLPLTDDELPAPLSKALGAAVEKKQEDFSQSAFAAAMQYWAVLLGLVSGEVFGHFPPVLTSGSSAPFFDFTCRRALIALGIRPEVLAQTASPGA